MITPCASLRGAGSKPVTLLLLLPLRCTPTNAVLPPLRPGRPRRARRRLGRVDLGGCRAAHAGRGGHPADPARRGGRRRARAPPVRHLPRPCGVLRLERVRGGRCGGGRRGRGVCGAPRGRRRGCARAGRRPRRAARRRQAARPAAGLVLAEQPAGGPRGGGRAGGPLVVRKRSPAHARRGPRALPAAAPAAVRRRRARGAAGAAVRDAAVRRGCPAGRLPRRGARAGGRGGRAAVRAWMPHNRLHSNRCCCHSRHMRAGRGGAPSSHTLQVRRRPMLLRRGSFKPIAPYRH
jgi:hypothetical protein